MEIDILIQNGILITMDPSRRIISGGSVAINKGQIVDLGENKNLVKNYLPARIINAENMVVMPGLIDGHAHAGHGFVKNLGSDPDRWEDIVGRVFSSETKEEYWYIEAQLSALERIKSGTTTGVSFLGGGDSVMRTDDPGYGNSHVTGVIEAGIRSIIAVGPRKPPFPHRYRQFMDGQWDEKMVSFDQQMETCENLIQKWNGKMENKIQIWLMFPVCKREAEEFGLEYIADLRNFARHVIELQRKYNTGFTQDGHFQGSILFNHNELGILNKGAVLSHAINLLPEEIHLCKQEDYRICHNPSAIASIMGYCPVPELIDAGVTVMLGSDGSAPDRGYDMFRHMFQAMHYQRTRFHDPSYLPAGKILEMATIDGAKALGLDNEIGSLETGKKADLILVDMVKPHIYPLIHPAQRIACYANGSDVHTVLVDGKIVMENREVKTLDEMDILKNVDRVANELLTSTSIGDDLSLPKGFWGLSKYGKRKANN